MERLAFFNQGICSIKVSFLAGTTINGIEL
jgi:hypothetical protein